MTTYTNSGWKVNNVMFQNSFKMYRAKFVLEIENSLSRVINLIENWIFYIAVENR